MKNKTNHVEQLINAWKLVKDKRHRYKHFPEPTTKRTKEAYYSSRYARLPACIKAGSLEQTFKAVSILETFFAQPGNEQTESCYQIHELIRKVYNDSSPNEDQRVTFSFAA